MTMTQWLSEAAVRTTEAMATLAAMTALALWLAAHLTG